MTSPAVDVILPFNKLDAYLIPAIKSVLASVGVQVRLLLVDDRLDSSEPIPALPGQNILILRTVERGYGKAISIGLKEVTADYCALMNADDLVHPNRLSRQIEDLVETSSELSIGRVIKFNNSGNVVSQKLGSLRRFNYSCEALLLGAYGADATWCGKTSVLKAWDFSHKPTTDWITALNYFGDTQITYSNSAFYFYRQHSNQVTKSKNYSRDSFKDVYPSWVALCKRLNMPMLDENSAVLVAAPWAVVSNPSREEVTNAANWLNGFETFTFHRYSNLVNRRILFLLRNTKGVNSINPMMFFFAVKGLVSYFIDIILNIALTLRFKKFLILK